MSLNKRTSFLVFLDVALFLSFPLGFAVICVSRFGLGFDALSDHLRLIADFAFVLYLLRLALSKLIAQRHIYILLSSQICTTFLLCLVTYYILVVIGISHWGKVISWEIVLAYSSQINSLLRIAEIVPSTALIGAISTVLVSALVIWFYFHKLDWLWLIRGQGLSMFNYIVLACILLFVVNDLRAFRSGYFAESGEPLSMSFFSELATAQFQSVYASRSQIAKYDQMAQIEKNAYTPAPNFANKNVIVIVSDALRPDHMSAYQYERITTPQIDELVRKHGIYQARQMHSVCNESSCGLFAISSSKYFHEFSYHPFTLQQALRMHGYTIRMILSGDHTNFYGLRDIYGEVDDYFDGSFDKEHYINDDKVVLSYLEKLQPWSGKAEYLQFHIMATHGIGQKITPSNEYAEQTNYYINRVDQREVASKKWNSVVNFYDSGVWTADMNIGRIINQLRSKSYLDNALVIITADHGELLGEQGQYGHSRTVLEPVLRIPFIMLDFELNGAKKQLEIIEGIRSQTDIAPSILQHLGIPIPNSWSGIPIQSKQKRDFIYFQSKTESGFFDLSNQTQTVKFWRDLTTKKEYAYDMLLDQSETKNIFSELPFAARKDWLLRLPQ